MNKKINIIERIYRVFRRHFFIFARLACKTKGQYIKILRLTSLGIGIYFFRNYGIKNNILLLINQENCDKSKQAVTDQNLLLTEIYWNNFKSLTLTSINWRTNWYKNSTFNWWPSKCPDVPPMDVWVLGLFNRELF